jgi:hypothetical protein
MKRPFAALVALLTLTPHLYAAYTSFPVHYQRVFIEDGRTRYETQRQEYAFRLDILGEDGTLKSENNKKGRFWITAQPEERYSLRLYNPLPVRVAVNVTVDGLNSITGKPSGITDGEKWLIEPYSYVTLRGWQVNGAQSRRFFFTPKPQSYAQWRGDQTGQDLAANCGVIGAAFFWNQKELDQYYEAHPIYRNTYRSWPVPCAKATMKNMGTTQNEMRAANVPAASDAADYNQGLQAQAPQEKAGTGMGEKESNPTTTVEFNYDRGMYRLAQALVVYYDFAPVEPQPNAFPAVSYAPEM